MTRTADRLDPICAIATAAGRGGVGIVRISSPQPLDALVAALCARPLAPRVATYTALLGAAGEALDHGIAIAFAAPHSYTGEHVLELQAHGGPVLLQLLLARCLAAAAEHDPARAQPRLARLRLARPGEFTERAFLNGKLDLAQAEAVADLIDASTEAAARSAGRALAGAFSQEVTALVEALVHLRMLVEATLDFPEEEIGSLPRRDAGLLLSKLQQSLTALQGRARQGALLREGLHVVIAGQPNAGKSSLLNALAGAERAIVTPIAGTTRDALRETIQIEGVPLHIIDTAGLREGGDTVEQIGISRAWQHIEAADCVLLLHDLTRANDAGYRAADDAIEAALAERLPRRVPVLHVWNKCDAVEPAAAETVIRTAPHASSRLSAAAENHDTAEAATNATLTLSARTGAGLDALRQRLLRAAGWQPGAQGDVFTARARHLQALADAAHHLDTAHAHLTPEPPALELVAEELRLAQQALGEITGEFTADDLLGVIFSRFCIGK